MEKTIECTECGWITDVEIIDLNAPRYCPECGGGFVVSGTDITWPTDDSALSGLPGTCPADEDD